VRVPVLRDGEVRYVLSAIVRPDAILRVVSQQRVPEDWIARQYAHLDRTDGVDARGILGHAGTIAEARRSGIAGPSDDFR